MIATTTTGTRHDVLAIGTMITFERTVAFSSATTVETAEIIGRNWSFERFDSYQVSNGRTVYPDMIRN